MASRLLDAEVKHGDCVQIGFDKKGKVLTFVVVGRKKVSEKKVRAKKGVGKK